MNATDLARLDATAQADLVREGQVTPTELVEASIEAVERLDPQLGAVFTRTFEHALDHAATVRKATDPAVTIKVEGPTVATEARERAATAAGVRHAKSAGGSARNAVSARSRSGPRSSRTRRP